MREITYCPVQINNLPLMFENISTVLSPLLTAKFIIVLWTCVFRRLWQHTTRTSHPQPVSLTSYEMFTTPLLLGPVCHHAELLITLSPVAMLKTCVRYRDSCYLLYAACRVCIYHSHKLYTGCSVSSYNKLNTNQFSNMRFGTQFRGSYV
jgi:hypothetical protein